MAPLPAAPFRVAPRPLAAFTPAAFPLAARPVAAFPLAAFALAACAWAAFPPAALPLAGVPVGGTPVGLAHGRNRGIETSSSASMAARVMMTSTISGVRTIDNHATMPANRTAHRYRIRTLARCECPMSSMR